MRREVVVPESAVAMADDGDDDDGGADDDAEAQRLLPTMRVVGSSTRPPSSSSSSSSSSPASNPPTRGRRIGTALFYAVSSIWVIFANKIVLSTYEFPSVLTIALLQFASTTLALRVACALGYVNLLPLTPRGVRSILPLSSCYLANILTGLSATRNLSLPMMVLLRRASILMTMVSFPSLRCGNTYMQYILLRVRMDGEEDFRSRPRRALNKIYLHSMRLVHFSCIIYIREIKVAGEVDAEVPTVHDRTAIGRSDARGEFLPTFLDEYIINHYIIHIRQKRRGANVVVVF